MVFFFLKKTVSHPNTFHLILTTSFFFPISFVYLFVFYRVLIALYASKHRHSSCFLSDFLFILKKQTKKVSFMIVTSHHSLHFFSFLYIPIYHFFFSTFAPVFFFIYIFLILLISIVDNVIIELPK